MSVMAMLRQQSGCESSGHKGVTDRYWSGSNYVRPRVAGLAALGEIDFQRSGGVEDGFDITFVVEIQIRPADGEPGVGDFFLALQYMQGVRRSGGLVEIRWDS
jgi:hypothetical protein